MTHFQTPIFGPYKESFDGDDSEKKYLLVPPADMEAIKQKMIDDAHFIDELDLRIREFQRHYISATTEEIIVEAVIDRMGWPEISAFRAELQKGQSIAEDAGGFMLRCIKRLFGVRHAPDIIASYQEAARALFRPGCKPPSATDQLIDDFAFALKVKLHAAAQKYGYGESWRTPGWMDECRQKLIDHIEKGDPRDVEAYCAFLWFHNESTSLAPAWPWVPIEQNPDLEQFDGHENNFLFFCDRTGTYDLAILDLKDIDEWGLGVTAGNTHYLVLDHIPAATPQKG